MERLNLFWNASLTELKQGYVQEKESFTCLLCGVQLEKGMVYPYESSFYEAERYMRIHIEMAHQSVFQYLLHMDKKFTGITDHQKNLLALFYEGKNDKDIQKELGIGSASTIRHHRFALKEKERQAKTFLAMMELLKEKDEHAPAFVPIHKTATMLDDRYNITDDEQTQIINKYFSKGTLTKFPSKEKHRLIILREITKHLEINVSYREMELNQLLNGFFEDYVLLRRYLIEYGFIDRKPDGSSYWVKN